MSDLGRVVRSYLASRKRSGGAVAKAGGGAFGVYSPAEQAEMDDVAPMKIERTPDETPVQFRTASPLVNITEGDIDRAIEVGLGAATIGDAGSAGPVRRGLRPKPTEGYNPVHESAPAAPAEAVPLDRPGVEGTPGGGAGLRTPELQAQRRAAGRPILPGLPTGRQQVSGEDFIPGPYGLAHDVAERYMASREGAPSLHYRAPEKYHDIDPEHSAAIAQAFEEMKHAPNDPAVKAAYDALIKETLAQYQAIKESGLKITPVNAADYPYHGNPRAVARDVADNNHMAFFKTDEGFGVGDAIHADNPMLLPSGEKIGEHNMLNNDLFRVVHDYFGHIKNGYGFRATGEDNAWRSHAAMYSDLARPAMTTETRGQNSWVNYGPHGEKNRTASGADTIYADQKVGLMPDWTMYDKGQAPPVMYHGSGQEYLRPDLNRLGSGQGEMAYGAGYYGSQGERVAKRYRDMQAQTQWTLNGQPASLLHAYESMRDSLMQTGVSAGRSEHVADAIGQLMEQGFSAAKIKNMASREGMEKEFDTALKVASKYKNTTEPGHMYKWAIEADPEHLLNWDTTFGKQTPHVQERVEGDMRQSVEGQRTALQGAIDRIRRGEGNYRRDDMGTRRAMRDLEDYEKRLATLTLQGLTGREVYRRMGLPAKDQTEAYVRASHQLKDKGIPGLRYKNISGGADSGVPNYVMFDPDKLRLLRRYADGGEVDAEGMAPENYEQMGAVGRGVLNVLHSIADVPRRAFQSSETMRKTGEYDPGPVLDAAMLPMGTGAIAGVPVKGAEAVLGAGAARMKPQPKAFYEGEPVINAGVDAKPNSKIQTVADPHRMMFPGIYKNPRVIAEEAVAQVGAEDPALKQLFGVTRDDLYQMGKDRVGNEPPNLNLAKNPRGSLSAQNIQTPQNTQRMIDVMVEAAKHEGLRMADAWYVMDPMYWRLKEMFGPEQAAIRYRHLNTTTGMASPGSEVMTEIQRGTGAHWLEQQGRFADFKKYAGLDNELRNAHRMPKDMRYIAGHPYHRTSQAEPMQKYFDAGSIQSLEPKVPLYVHASGVPETGFQTTGPVGDAHYSRAAGLSDTRRGPTDVGGSFTRAEYQTLQPWWQHEVAKPLGLESVPAQARTWTTFGPQTGVESELGAPKLELFAKQIMRAAKRLGVSPETARDMILSGKAGAGKRGGAVGPNFAEGGAAGDDYNTPVDEAAFQGWRAVNAPNDSGVDYDLRGAYQANVQRAQDGHMTDRFKKPNHPTFSDQSQYATGDQRARAGHWVGDTFVPPSYAEGGSADEEPVAAPTFDPAKFAAFKSATPAPAATPPSFDPAKFAAFKVANQKPMDAGEVLSEAAMNTPASAWQFAKDVVHPFIHPIETATSIKDLGLGVAEKAANRLRHEWGGQPVPGEHEKYADAMGTYLADRYGGGENIKRAFAKDPVGVLSDASMILTGGGSAGARLPGILGKTGEIVGAVGRAVDPLMAPVNAAKVGTKMTGELLTHTGATPLETAYRTGVEGGEAADVFRDQMRGSGDMVAPVAMAKQGLEGYRAARAKSYREGMGDITSIDRQMDPLDRVLDFGKIDDAVDKARKVQTFGTRVLDKGANEVRNAMITEINEWKALPPADYHTIEGLDALKRSLGHMMMDTAPGTSSRKAAGDIYNAVRQTIVDYDPKYAKVMKDYEMASAQVRELERAMSLGEKASADTALRKLQSIMRNNVNANYGRRLELGQLLQEHGATHLMSALAGQSASAWFPRGLGKFVASADLAGAVGAAGVHGFNPLPLVGAAVTLPLMSPKLMGETAHFAGRTAGRALERTNKGFGKVGLGNRSVGNASYRLGRATNPYENADPANPYAP